MSIINHVDIPYNKIYRVIRQARSPPFFNNEVPLRLYFQIVEIFCTT